MQPFVLSTAIHVIAESNKPEAEIKQYLKRILHLLNMKETTCSIDSSEGQIVLDQVSFRYVRWAIEKVGMSQADSACLMNKIAPMLSLVMNNADGIKEIADFVHRLACIADYNELVFYIDYFFSGANPMFSLADISAGVDYKAYSSIVDAITSICKRIDQRSRLNLKIGLVIELLDKLQCNRFVTEHNLLVIDQKLLAGANPSDIEFLLDHIFKGFVGWMPYLMNPYWNCITSNLLLRIYHQAVQQKSYGSLFVRLIEKGFMPNRILVASMIFHNQDQIVEEVVIGYVQSVIYHCHYIKSVIIDCLPIMEDHLMNLRNSYTVESIVCENMYDYWGSVLLSNGNSTKGFNECFNYELRLHLKTWPDPIFALERAIRIARAAVAVSLLL